MTLSPQTTERPRWRRWLPWLIGASALLVICGIVVVAGGLYFLFGSSGTDLLGTTLVDKLTNTQVEEATGVTLPAGAQNLHSHYASFQDYIVHTRFELDPAEIPAFLSTLPITSPTISSTERPNMYSDGMPSWWRPAEAQSFQAVSGQVTTPAGHPDYQSVLVDTTNPQVAIIYIVAFDT